MNDVDMILKAGKLGFSWPMRKLDNETLKCYGKDDVVFLRFIENEVHVYEYKRSHRIE